MLKGGASADAGCLDVFSASVLVGILIGAAFAMACWWIASCALGNPMADVAADAAAGLADQHGGPASPGAQV